MQTKKNLNENHLKSLKNQTILNHTPKESRKSNHTQIVTFHTENTSW